MNFENQTHEQATYKFNELTSITGVKPYVLRFWESEFDQICPSLSEGGHKIYSNQDLEFIQRVKTFLFEEKLSIPEAKSKFDEELKLLEIKREEETRLQYVSQRAPDEQELQAERSSIAFQSSSLDMVKNALANDLLQKREVLVQKQFNDKDILNLVQAKKKLTTVLSKINNIITENNW